MSFQSLLDVVVGRPEDRPDESRQIPDRRRLAAATIQLGAAVGQEMQTYWDGDKTWFSGRVIEGRVDPVDGAAWVHIEYFSDTSCEWIRLDDSSFTNPVLYSVTTRSAWCRVKGFPWWPAQQLLLSNSNAQESRRQRVTVKSLGASAVTASDSPTREVTKCAPVDAAVLSNTTESLPSTADKHTLSLRQIGSTLLVPKPPELNTSKALGTTGIIESIDGSPDAPCTDPRVLSPEGAQRTRRASDPASRRIKELMLLQRWDNAESNQIQPLLSTAGRSTRSLNVTAMPSVSPSTIGNGGRRGGGNDQPPSPSVYPEHISSSDDIAGVKSTVGPRNIKKKAGCDVAAVPLSSASAHPSRRSTTRSGPDETDSSAMKDEASDVVETAGSVDADDVLLDVDSSRRPGSSRRGEKDKRQRGADRNSMRTEERRYAAPLSSNSEGMSIVSGSATFRFLGDDTTVWAKVTDAPALDVHSYSASALKLSALPLDLVETLSTVISTPTLTRGTPAVASIFNRIGPTPWRWSPPEWHRPQAVSNLYATSLLASARSVATTALAQRSIASSWRASSAAEVLRTYPTLLPLDARQAAALACAITGLPLDAILKKRSDASNMLAGAPHCDEDAAGCASRSSGIIDQRETNCSEIVSPEAAVLICLLADSGAFAPIASAITQGNGVNWLWNVPPKTVSSLTAAPCIEPSSTRSDIKQQIPPPSASTDVSGTTDDARVEHSMPCVASSSSHDLLTNPVGTQPRRSLHKQKIADPAPSKSSVRVPSGTKSTAGGGGSAAIPLHATAWVGRWVAWWDYSYDSSAAAVQLSEPQVECQREQRSPQQPRMVEYVNRLTSLAEMHLAPAPHDANGIDVDGGVPASWFNIVESSAGNPRVEDVSSSYISAVKSTLKRCQVRSPTHNPYFSASPPSAYGRWVGGWIARFDATSGLHLIVYDTPMSAALPSDQVALLDAVFCASGAGIGFDPSSLDERAGESTAPHADPVLVTREWVRLDDHPVVLLPIESRLLRAPPPAVLPSPRIFRGRSILSHAEVFLRRSHGQPLPTYSTDSSQSIVCSICFHSGSNSDPLLLCSSDLCRQACHVSCFDPLRAAGVASSVLALKRRTGAASEHQQSARLLRLLPRTVRDDIFGFAIQQRNSFDSPVKVSDQPAAYKTQWLCQVCRCCDSCGSAHPGGPFAQNASSLAIGLMDAVASGILSTTRPRTESTSHARQLEPGASTPRSQLPLWARGGVCCPADSCVSDTAACIKAADTLVTAFSAQLEATAIEAPPRSGEVLSREVDTDVVTEEPLQTTPGENQDLQLGSAAASSAPKQVMITSANAALTSALRKLGFGAAATAHSRHGHQIPKGWATPDLAMADRLRWGIHSFTPIPGTLQYNSRRSAALASVASSSSSYSDGAHKDAPVLPSVAVEQLLCSYCVRRISDGCFCPVCHGAYTDGDGQMVQCDDCDGWVHAPCDGLTSDDLISMAASTHAVWGKRYTCPLCRHRAMQRLLADLREEDRAGHFALPVSGASAPGYHNVISSPMDLWTIGRLLDAGRYDSPSPFTAPLSSGAAAALAGINAFRGHLELIVRNAVVFNTPQDRVYKDAWRFHRSLAGYFSKHLPQAVGGLGKVGAELRQLRAGIKDKGLLGELGSEEPAPMIEAVSALPITADDRNLLKLAPGPPRASSSLHQGARPPTGLSRPPRALLMVRSQLSGPRGIPRPVPALGGAATAQRHPNLALGQHSRPSLPLLNPAQNAVVHRPVIAIAQPSLPEVGRSDTSHVLTAGQHADINSSTHSLNRDRNVGDVRILNGHVAASAQHQMLVPSRGLVATQSRSRLPSAKSAASLCVTNEHAVIPTLPPTTLPCLTPFVEVTLAQTEALRISTLDLCAVCGGSYTSESLMLACCDCGEAFHAQCVAGDFLLRLVATAQTQCAIALSNSSQIDSASIHLPDPCHPAVRELVSFAVSQRVSRGWRCSGCKVCEVCGECLPRHESSLLFCDGCDAGVHMFCCSPQLETPPKGEWFCGCCVECERCGPKGSTISDEQQNATSSLPARWSPCIRLCYECVRATDWTDSKEEKSQPATATIEYVHRSAMMRGRSVALVDGAAAADSVPPPGARGRGRGGRGRGRGGAGIGAKTPFIDRTTLVEMPEQRGRGRGFAHELGSGSATVVSIRNDNIPVAFAQMTDTDGADAGACDIGIFEPYAPIAGAKRDRDDDSIAVNELEGQKRHPLSPKEPLQLAHSADNLRCFGGAEASLRATSSAESVVHDDATDSGACVNYHDAGMRAAAESVLDSKSNRDLSNVGSDHVEQANLLARCRTRPKWVGQGWTVSTDQALWSVARGIMSHSQHITGPTFRLNCIQRDATTGVGSLLASALDLHLTLRPSGMQSPPILSLSERPTDADTRACAFCGLVGQQGEWPLTLQAAISAADADMLSPNMSASVTEPKTTKPYVGGIEGMLLPVPRIYSYNGTNHQAKVLPDGPPSRKLKVARTSVAASDSQSSKAEKPHKSSAPRIADSHWVHVGCALWSANVGWANAAQVDVSTNSEGTSADAVRDATSEVPKVAVAQEAVLVGVQSAIRLARRQICSLCGCVGASIACSQKSCSARYHLRCAILDGVALGFVARAAATVTPSVVHSDDPQPIVLPDVPCDDAIIELSSRSLVNEATLSVLPSGVAAVAHLNTGNTEFAVAEAHASTAADSSRVTPVLSATIVDSSGTGTGVIKLSNSETSTQSTQSMNLSGAVLQDSSKVDSFAVRSDHTESACVTQATTAVMCAYHRPDAGLVRNLTNVRPSLTLGCFAPDAGGATSVHVRCLPSDVDLAAVLASTHQLRQALLATLAMTSTQSLTRVVIGPERHFTDEEPSSVPAERSGKTGLASDLSATAATRRVEKRKYKRRGVSDVAATSAADDERHESADVGKKRSRPAAATKPLSDARLVPVIRPSVSLAHLPVPPLSRCLRVLGPSLSLPPAYAEFFGSLQAKDAAATVCPSGLLDKPLGHVLSACFGDDSDTVLEPCDVLQRAAAAIYEEQSSRAALVSRIPSQPVPGLNMLAFTHAPFVPSHSSSMRSALQRATSLRAWLRLLPDETARHEPNAPCLRVGGLTVLRWGRVVFDRPSFCTSDCLFPVGYRAIRLWWGAVKSEEGRVGLGRVAYTIDVVDPLPCGEACICHGAAGSTGAHSASSSSPAGSPGRPNNISGLNGSGYCAASGPLFVISSDSDPGLFIVEHSPEAAFAALRLEVVERVGLPAVHLLSRPELALVCSAASADATLRAALAAGAHDSTELFQAAQEKGSAAAGNTASQVMSTGRIPIVLEGLHASTVVSGPSSRLHWGGGSDSSIIGHAANPSSPLAAVLRGADTPIAADAYGLSARVWCGFAIPAVQRCLETLPETILAMITPLGSSSFADRGRAPPRWARYVYRYHSTPSARLVGRAKAFRLDSRLAGASGKAAIIIPPPAVPPRLVAYDRTSVSADQRRRTILAAERFRTSLKASGGCEDSSNGNRHAASGSRSALAELLAADRLSMGDTRQSRAAVPASAGSASRDVVRGAPVTSKDPAKILKRKATPSISKGTAAVESLPAADAKLNETGSGPLRSPEQPGGAVDADAGVRSVLNREAEVKSEAAPSVTEADVSRSAVSVSNASDLGPVAVSDSDTRVNATDGDALISASAPSGVPGSAPTNRLETNDSTGASPAGLAEEAVAPANKTRRASAVTSLQRLHRVDFDVPDACDVQPAVSGAVGVAAASEVKARASTKATRPKVAPAAPGPAGVEDAHADVAASGGETGEGISDSRLALLYRALRSEPMSRRLAVRRSPIHGWGLFTRLAVPKDAMLIEYCGDKVRQAVADRREVMYEEEARALHNLLNTASDPSKPRPTPEPDLLALFGLNAPGGAALKIPGDPAGLPSHSDGACYLFRIDDEWIVDATTTGGPARFVNHCCEPNCYSKVIVVDGDKHIVIMSARALAAGEELTYDYKFAVEVEPGAKIPCACGAPSCSGSMN